MIAHFYFLINIKPRMFCERFISWKLQKCFGKIRKLFWKKKTFIHLFQWICVPYLRLFRKLISLRNNYEPPSMRTLIGATTEREVKSVKKQLKTKKRLFKMFQKDKKQKFENFSNEASKTAWIVIKKSDMYYQNFWKKNCFSGIITIRMQIILIKSKF